MVTTVTDTTLELVASSSSLILITLLTVIVLLIQKEIVGTLDDQRSARWSRMLNIVLAPLFGVFAAVVLYRLVSFFR